MDTSAEQFSSVQAVLLDPSCSGSGTQLRHLDHSQDALVEHASSLKDPEPPGSLIGHGAAPQPDVAPAQAGSAALHAALSSNADKARPKAEQDGSFPGVHSCDSARVRKLTRFQTHILRHALTFPKLQRLVYSTCSVYRQENEDVVAAVLPHARQFGFELQKALPQWPRRGLPGTYEWADHVVRVHPDLDGTDGFFLALFVQRGPASDAAWSADVRDEPA